MTHFSTNYGKEKFNAYRREYGKQRRSDRATWGKMAINWLRSRVAKTGMELTITASDLVVPELCPALGTPIVLGGGKNSQNCPSVDRVDNSKGYVQGNVEIISGRANRIKYDATANEIYKVACYAARHLSLDQLTAAAINWA